MAGKKQKKIESPAPVDRSNQKFSARAGAFESLGMHNDPQMHFNHPDQCYAPYVFWYWNGGFKRKRFEYVTREISQKGLNPGFAHCRIWRRIPQEFWMSSGWLDLFEDCLKVCEKNGTHMSYTAGDPCFPDNRILEKYPEMRRQSLYWEKRDIDSSAELPESLFTVAAQLDDNKRILSSTLQIIGEGDAFCWTPPAGIWRIFSYSTYFKEISGHSSADCLDRRTFERWREVEHDIYDKRVGKYFGNVMNGVFFDLEGSYGYRLVWSHDLSEKYQLEKGTDIRLHMPLMDEEDAEGLWAKARWDWLDCVTHLYTETLFDPMTEWCAERGMFHLCHTWEHDLYAQALEEGSFFHVQRSFSMPTTDALFLTGHRPDEMHECRSICELEGKGFSCEAMAVAGFHVNSVDLKRMANNMIAWGITQFMPGGINTDPNLNVASYPPDLFEENPYWCHIDQWADFIRRASYINDLGRLDVHIGVLCPMDSIWPLLGDQVYANNEPGEVARHPIERPYIHDSAHADEIIHIDRVYQETMTRLRYANIDFLAMDRHYIDAFEIGEGKCHYGDFSFDTLILPPLKLLSLTTAKKLLTAARNGVKIYALGSLPAWSSDHGANDREMCELMDKLSRETSFIDCSAEPGAIVSRLPHAVTFEEGNFQLLSQCRIIDGKRFVYLVNDTPEEHLATLRIAGAEGRAELWNCQTGEITPVGTEDKTGFAKFTYRFQAWEAFWLVFDSNQEALLPEPLPEESTIMDISSDWLISVDMEQMTTSFGNPVIPNGFISGIRKECLADWADWGFKAFAGHLDYTKEIELTEVTGTEILELTDVKYTAEVSVNGKTAGARMYPPFRFEIGNLLKPGVNTIRVRVGNSFLNEVITYPEYQARIPADAEEKSVEELQGGFTVFNRYRKEDLYSGIKGRILLKRIKR